MIKGIITIFLYLVIGTIVAAVRLFVYNVDLDDFVDFDSSSSDDDQLATMFIILGWPLYGLMKLALIVPKGIVFLIRKYVQKGDIDDQG